MNQTVYRRRPGSSIPNVIFALLIANGLVFALQQTSAEFMFLNFALWPATDPRSPFMPWQLLTYGFLHGNTTHIFFNMFGLWMFGRDLEQFMGSQRFLIYFLVCVVGAGIVQLVVAAMQGGLYPTVGASGGVFGILLAYGLTFPNRVVVPLFPPIPMRAITFVFIYGLLELYLGVSGGAPGVANFAHLGGMLFGFLLIQYWRRGRRRR
ncbi:MAG: rhomboid family intramembrane serine protease [Gammaproteobacteria bacterium]|nr:rhomboid family intramembrane serine protease [Gammaproteobacteria bacterium]MBU2678030.1 rhomboid family intramembrane serine protease [Gammaproteobacteria bacterium]NNC55994.1 rhomboid family intramembrane serine protease [Woeseiaceae bacterium]NNL51765.1 rhomboid family intramembrane serine protease [Woeseiaceae bacterium]